MRVSIITGGGSGIGAAVARRLAGPDQGLMLHGQCAEASGLARLNSVAEECRSKGAKVAVSTGDLAGIGAGTSLVEAARAAFGPIDAIVHAAGFADRREFASLPRAALERAFAVMVRHSTRSRRPRCPTSRAARRAASSRTLRRRTT